MVDILPIVVGSYSRVVGADLSLVRILVSRLMGHLSANEGRAWHLMVEWSFWNGQGSPHGGSRDVIGIGLGCGDHWGHGKLAPLVWVHLGVEKHASNEQKQTRKNEDNELNFSSMEMIWGEMKRGKVKSQIVHLSILKNQLFGKKYSYT